MNEYLAVRPRADALLRLFCFHHAGAGATAYAGWAARIGGDVSVVPVRLPGRERRLGEPRITDAHRLFDELDQHLGATLEQGPYAFYGHSLGALVAHGFAQHLTAAGLRPPEALVVGACTAPHLASGLTSSADLPDDQLLRILASFDGVPAELHTRPAWLRTMLAITRADLMLGRSLREAARDALPCPLWAFAGQGDQIAVPAAVAGWKRWTTSSFRFRTLPGGHFFIRDRTFPRLLGEELTSLTAPARAQPAPY
ncbi:thioesterase domain-containing protein [Kitasatospora sp. NPDC097643]|uniref:thioesterase II family protein n=1 Tax=Kitasatospora sp. NPDC097643 TaxID=3157230 RepID=UPI00331F7F06